MNKFKVLLGTLAFCSAISAEAREYVGDAVRHSAETQGNGLRSSCARSQGKEDLNINNVRTRLQTGGDMWWDRDVARYIVPNVDPQSGEPEVSALFNGTVWLSALDLGNNQVIAALRYGPDTDFWPGPLTSAGTIDKATCENWDRHFVVSGASIEALRTDILLDGVVDNPVALDLKKWPGRGNPYFEQYYGFPLPDQDLAPFIDYDGDGLYDPAQGDHPIIEVTGCDENSNDYDSPVYADQMIWWVYNDKGNIHTESQGNPMSMEVQVTAFAYATTDAINNMTFYRYKLLNKNPLTVTDTHFSLWSDPDLGCPENDFIGCDTLLDLGYVYQTVADGQPLCNDTDIPGYGAVPPALGVDYFRGPLDEFGNELGMSSFQYHVNEQSVTGDPSDAEGYFNLQRGRWSNNTAVSYGGNGYDPANTDITPYVFPTKPCNNSAPNAWSMDNSVGAADFRFLHTSGPFTLLPGATNEMISGVVWVPQVNTCLDELVEADILAQNLFDGCFRITNGPDAPFIDVVELENELVLNLTYPEGKPNVLFEYAETPPELRGVQGDSTYSFQGYKVYQVKSANISVTDLDDPSLARLIWQSDVQDSISKIINWAKNSDPDLSDVSMPSIMVEGSDNGLQHTLKVTTDAFNSGTNQNLVNFKPYYYCVIAYAHNEYEPYDNIANTGQSKPYLQGRLNFNIYEGMPRPNNPEYFGATLNASYGDSPEITRKDGIGVGNGNFVEVKDIEIVESTVLSNNIIDEITYQEGKGPFGIKVVDPLRVPNGDFELFIYDDNFVWDTLNNVISANYAAFNTPASLASESTMWYLQEKGNPANSWSSYAVISNKYEHYIADLGISLTINQVAAPGNGETDPTKSGFIGDRMDYLDENATPWMIEGGVMRNLPFINKMLQTSNAQDDQKFDPQGDYTASTRDVPFIPHLLADCKLRSTTDPQGTLIADYAITPNRHKDGANAVHICDNFHNEEFMMNTLRNVNIVYTTDKSKWSRCIVVETASKYHTAASPAGLELTPGSGFSQLDWKDTAISIDKDGNEEASTGGMSWFPGYAYDVVTGERLNIFFGENSIYDGNLFSQEFASNGNDMIYNPSDASLLLGGDNESSDYMGAVYGGHHFVFVSNSKYDSCQIIKDAYLASGLFRARSFNVASQKLFMWAGLPLLTPGTSFTGEKKNVPPSDVRLKLRVDRPYDVYNATGDNKAYPKYEFALDGYAPSKEDDTAAESALDLINVVPNPYYIHSEYEVTELDNTMRITNLPPACDIRIYSVEGQFIREFTLGRQYTDRTAVDDKIINLGSGVHPNIENQITTFQDWDLKNYANVPVSSGVYLIHIKVDGVGERVLKAFIVSRLLDAQGL